VLELWDEFMVLYLHWSDHGEKNEVKPMWSIYIIALGVWLGGIAGLTFLFGTSETDARITAGTFAIISVIAWVYDKLKK